MGLNTSITSCSHGNGTLHAAGMLCHHGTHRDPDPAPLIVTAILVPSLKVRK